MGSRPLTYPHQATRAISSRRKPDSQPVPPHSDWVMSDMDDPKAVARPLHNEIKSEQKEMLMNVLSAYLEN